MRKQTSDKKFIRFAGSMDQIIEHSFRMKCQNLGKLIFEDMDEQGYKKVLFERKFWSETFERMMIVKRTS